MRKFIAGALLLATGCGAGSSGVEPAAHSGSRLSAAAATALPVAVQSDAQMKAAGNHGPSSTGTLHALSCKYAGSRVTATGTFVGGFVPEIYRRAGDVVELYVFTRRSPGYPAGIQLGVLHEEAPGTLNAKKWRATVPLDTSLGRPARCLVAAQPTHDWQAAPSAY